MIAGPAISIVVPTRDRPGPLAGCLAALEGQTAPDYEIVVVDDGSADGEAVAGVVAGAAHARLVRGTGRGPAAARNLGAAAARAPILCFTDDDCRPSPGWAEALARRLTAGTGAPAAGPETAGTPPDSEPGARTGPAPGAEALAHRLTAGAGAGTGPGAGSPPAGGAALGAVPAPGSDAGPAAHTAAAGTGADPAAAAGPTHNARPGDAFAAASQAITNHLTGAGLDRATGRLAFAPTSNLACRAEVVRALPFDETYPLAAGEDRDWCARLAGEGLTLAFEPWAWVAHDQDLSLRRFWRQQVRYGRGARRWQRDRPPGARLQPARFYSGLVRAGFAAGPAAGGLVLLAQLATAAGLAAEALSPAGEPATPGRAGRHT